MWIAGQACWDRPAATAERSAAGDTAAANRSAATADRSAASAHHPAAAADRPADQYARVEHEFGILIGRYVDTQNPLFLRLFVTSKTTYCKAAVLRLRCLHLGHAYRGESSASKTQKAQGSSEPT